MHTRCKMQTTLFLPLFLLITSSLFRPSEQMPKTSNHPSNHNLAYSSIDTEGDSLLEEFEYWAKKYDRTYASEAEKNQRFNIWKARKAKVEKLRLEHPNSPAMPNLFADMTVEELNERYAGHFVAPDKSHYVNTSKATSSSPDELDYDTCGESMDWSVDMEDRTLYPPLNQDTCGSCWAFAVAASIDFTTLMAQIENNYSNPQPPHPRLSMQQLLDCSNVLSNCVKGSPDFAYMYVKENGGLTTADNYPYTGIKGECDKDKERQTVLYSNIPGYDFVPRRNETELIMALCRQPVMVAVSVTYNDEFYGYGGGYVFDKPCNNTEDLLDHAMLLVGMGFAERDDGSTIKYWKLMNSWGPEWGESGYMRLIRDTGEPEGHCGINMYPMYPYFYDQAG